MNRSKSTVSIFALALTSTAALAGGGSSGSHGGGAWVCREDGNQTIRWAKLIDTFEASSDPRVAAQFPTTTAEALKLAQQRIQDAGATNVFIAASKSSACPYFPSQMNCSFTTNGAGTILPSDANTVYRPLPDMCAGGTISREAVALRSQGRNVSLVRELFDKLSAPDQVALALHETLYTYASFANSVTNSDSIRPLVAKLVMLGSNTLSSPEKAQLKVWSQTDLERSYWVDFEFRSWADSAWAEIMLEEAEFKFKSNECVAVADTGIVLGHKTSHFKCRKMIHTYWNDASPTPQARLIIFFPDQMTQPVTQDFHLVAHGIDGDIIDYRGQPTQRAFFNKLIPLNVNYGRN